MDEVIRLNDYNEWQRTKMKMKQKKIKFEVFSRKYFLFSSQQFIISKIIILKALFFHSKLRIICWKSVWCREIVVGIGRKSVWIPPEVKIHLWNLIAGNDLISKRKCENKKKG